MTPQEPGHAAGLLHLFQTGGCGHAMFSNRDRRFLLSDRPLAKVEEPKQSVSDQVKSAANEKAGSILTGASRNAAAIERTVTAGSARANRLRQAGEGRMRQQMGRMAPPSDPWAGEGDGWGDGSAGRPPSEASEPPLRIEVTPKKPVPDVQGPEMPLN